LNKRWLYLALALLIVVAAVVFLMRRRAAGPSEIDLIARFPDAEKRTTMASLHEGFNVIDVDIRGQTKRCIFAHPHSRIIWKIEVPERAMLTTAVALQMHVWDHNGDGAIFRIGISDGKEYTELFRRSLDPYRREEDRRWIPVELDLARWGGQQVQVIFNTDPGEIGNAVNDAAVWGDPKISVVAATSE
jgi:hypothetical protein